METYQCKDCKEKKPVNEFGPAPTRLGHRLTCRKCHSAYQRKYYKDNPTKYEKHKKYVAANDLAYNRSAITSHHLTMEDYVEMYNLYDGMCHACQSRPIKDIDHDHSCCGRLSCGNCVRGLLCGGCNTALGHMRDNRESLLKLISFLDSPTYKNYKPFKH